MANAAARLEAASYVRLDPKRETGAARNEIWVPAGVAAVIYGATADSFPHWRADALLARFIFGYDLGFSLLGDPSGKQPEIEKLHTLDEAWAICFRSPRPGWRLFGRFYAVGSFVGSCVVDRHKIPTATIYQKRAEQAVQECEALFPGIQPVRGSDPNDYWHGAARDVDAVPVF